MNFLKFAFIIIFPVFSAHAMKMEVNYGDKITKIEIRKAGEGSEIIFSNGEKSSLTKKITSKNYEYLRKRLNALPNSSHGLEYCQRSFIKTETENGKLIGCLQSPTKLSREMKDIANLVSLYF